LFPATVPKAWADIKRAFSLAAWTGSEPDWPLLILHITMGGFLLLMLGALVTGATHYLERYMHPFFLLTPLWMLSVVQRTENAGRKAKVLAVILAASLLIVFPIRVRDSLHAMGPPRACARPFGYRESDFWLASCEPGRSRNYCRGCGLTNFPASLLEI
jgi:hypothetical protein